MKFKKGDRVKLIYIIEDGAGLEDCEKAPLWGGKYGFVKGDIIQTFSDDFTYDVMVSWDNGESFQFYESEIGYADSINLDFLTEIDI